MGGRDEELVAGKSGDVHAFRRLGNEVAVSSREKCPSFDLISSLNTFASSLKFLKRHRNEIVERGTDFHDRLLSELGYVHEDGFIMS